jgi:glutamate formiminotransferase / formiminotetrahydrofolate cyclodeaminase
MIKENMTSPLVECIPNFSEGRRPQVVDAIIAALKSGAGVQVLDHHSDIDHNRTVVTLIGEPTAMEIALFSAIKKAAELIDLDTHQGEHPRMGATDVVPFVPISGISMAECVEMARRLGKKVGEELGIPVYLYEEAATRPDRHNLEDIRRGQYEGLKIEIETNPDRIPDFGPSKLGKAGATVIGAREPLVAFNIYLTTGDVGVAKKIAKIIRFSSGGLRYLKAMGVLVNGSAQVSMNLTDFRKTSIAQVVEMVRREARRYGVEVHHSELVGLIPQQALVDAAVWYMQLDGFESHQILENELMTSVSGMTKSIEAGEGVDFLDQLASAAPTPGGGSASAYTAAEGAALIAMVGRLTVGKKKYAPVEKEMLKMVGQAEQLRRKLTLAVKEDAGAFEKVMAAMKLSKESPEQELVRKEAIQKASLEAASVPLLTANLALEVMVLSVLAARSGNSNAISDAATASALAHAAIVGAGGNVRINLTGISEDPRSQPILKTLDEIEQKASVLDLEIRTVVKERANLILW